MIGSISVYCNITEKWYILQVILYLGIAMKKFVVWVFDVSNMNVQCSIWLLGIQFIIVGIHNF